MLIQVTCGVNGFYQATGRWFCSGANVNTDRDGDTTVRDVILNGFAGANTDTSKAVIDQFISSAAH
jgi:hypothetical protein